MFVTIRILQKEVSLVNAPHTCIRYQSNGNQKKKASQLDLQIELQGWYLEQRGNIVLGNMDCVIVHRAGHMDELTVLYSPGLRSLKLSSEPPNIRLLVIFFQFDKIVSLTKLLIVTIV